ncbi:MAG: hypothetical protein AB7K64_12470 [Variibacter sp.]
MRFRIGWARALRGTAGAVLVLAGIAAAGPARALDVTCIEASRYKYLYRIFDNDRARFAEFFGADARRLPPPEACRAVILTGTIDKPQRGESQGTDFDRLLAAIESGRGWLTTLYLATPGGNVGMGLRLANLTRMFWLNTYAVDGPSFDYVPDFLGAHGPGSAPEPLPPELQQGWESYRAATGALSHIELASRRERRCVSACTFLHAAGIYRHGPAYFHRARRGRSHKQRDGGTAEASSMADMLEGLQKTEQRIVAHYRKMDSGEEAIRAYESTATQTTARAKLPAFPHYIGDYLRKLCHTHPRRGAGERMAVRERSGAGEVADNAKPSADREQGSEKHGLSIEARQCIAAANTREQHNQYAKLCYDGCDRATLIRETTRRIRALMPREQEGEPRRRER